VLVVTAREDLAGLAEITRLLASSQMTPTASGRYRLLRRITVTEVAHAEHRPPVDEDPSAVG
jgi:hypothetical protein